MNQRIQFCVVEIDKVISYFCFSIRTFQPSFQLRQNIQLGFAEADVNKTLFTEMTGLG